MVRDASRIRVVPNGTSGQKEICSSADMLVPLLICVISARSDLHVLTQEKKSLPTNSDKSDGRTPSGESAETATAGNYSLSFGKVLFKFVFKFLKTKKTSPFTATAHCNHLHKNWQKLKFLPKPTERDVLEVTRSGCAPLITHCNAEPDMERMAAVDLDRRAVIFNHQSRPSATVLPKHIKFMDSKASYKLPGAKGQLHCPLVHWGAAGFILSRPGCSTKGTVPTVSVPSLALGGCCFLIKPGCRLNVQNWEIPKTT